MMKNKKPVRVCLMTWILCYGISRIIQQDYFFSLIGTTDPATGSPTTPSRSNIVAKCGDLRLCLTNDWNYVCEGPKYDEFADKLESWLVEVTNTNKTTGRNTSTTKRKSSSWGKRCHSPLPANTTILAVGNSHTRQIIHAIFCQYELLQLTEPELAANMTVDTKRRGAYYLVEFLNHAKIHLVTNHALFYSRKWLQYLEDTVQVKLQNFDALIVGKFNTFTESFNTSFMEIMLEKTSKLEDADFTKVPPPTLLDFANIFHGPIVAHSMMAGWGGHDNLNREMMELVRKAKSKSKHRSNIRFVNGRQYIPLFGECTAGSPNAIGICDDKMSAHRCTGQRGGHPDLVAWDLIEALNECLKPS